jgi:GntR family transcriptional repressor for pyruvate dehydrogenase complex
VKVRQDLSVLRALEQRSVVDEVKEQILELIREGEYRPGDRLPSEKDFAEVLRVSRTSVRQALASVATYGMIESKPGLGYFVCEISPGSVFNIVLVPSLLADETLKYLQEVRSIIEVEAISLAVDRATSDDLDRLDSILESMKIEPNYAALGLKCHIQVVASAHNLVLDSLYGVIADVILSNLDKLYHSTRTREEELESHRMLVDALKSRNHRIARNAMISHLKEVSELLAIALLRRSPVES